MLNNSVGYLSESWFSAVASFRVHHTSFFMPNPPRSCDRLDDDLLSCDRRQGNHMTSEGQALRPEEGCVMHPKASH